ncbi:uncharacterized protein LOC131438596 isoform X2 [Malaya genurostris]|uniref:uncharacterized protein LOC131438596 isoform X2 n=1 Tax=Malaya genurostris TaxID=325434 RepID=UPI0026F39026|nr:uncharacterized protein LOC131438596 isoform X2 [Malaya genurostris]
MKTTMHLNRKMMDNVVAVIIALCVLPSLLLVSAQQQHQHTLAESELQAQGLVPHRGEQISARRFKRMYAMCPPHFFRIGNECYFISQNKQNWLDAHFECKDRNSKLAEPMRYDDKYLRKFLQMSKEKNYIWIGGNYNWRTNKWQWGYNGKDIGYQSFSQMVPGQDLKYHCAVLNPDLKFRWSAKLCTEKQNFICQHKMPFVNSHSRKKVYNRWNATFPNEMANEVEVVVADQPRSSKQRDYYSTSNNTENNTINPTTLYDRIKHMKSTNRTLRIRPSRRRILNRNKLLPKNDYISNDIYRRPVVEYVQDSNNELNSINGNGHRNGHGSSFLGGFNVDIHRQSTNKNRHNRLNEVTADYHRPHQHRHHQREPHTKPTEATTTSTTKTTTTTTARTTTTAPETRPTQVTVQTVTKQQQQHHSEHHPMTREEKKARRDRVRERLGRLTDEEREKFFAERAKRKRSKEIRSRNETIP